MSAATELTAAAEPQPDTLFAPLGSPVTRGRLCLGRARPLVVPHTARSAPALLIAGFRTVAWLGFVGAGAPYLGPLAHHAEVRVDAAGRVTIDRRARAWLAVADPASFRVVLIANPSGGLLVVPVEDFSRRFREVTDARRAG